jgi:UDP-N-acetylglucosamine 4,6-dehydratase
VIFWSGKRVLITGGTGSWGQEFVKQLHRLECGKVVVFSRDEWKQAIMARTFAYPELRFLLGDVRDYERVKEAVKVADIVIHLAALKQVGAGEYAPFEFVKTNVLGAMNVAKACLESTVERALYIGSDKAVEATTLYGMTKAVAEKVWLGSNMYSPLPNTPYFSVARFGNVLGTRGSVLEVWREQISKGEPITITNPAMTRFIITLPRVVECCLHWIPTMKGQEIFIPDMPAVSIGELAEAYAPGYPQRVIGSRGAGEKDHEVLMPGGLSSRDVCRQRPLPIEVLRKLLIEAGFPPVCRQ